MMGGPPDETREERCARLGIPLLDLSVLKPAPVHHEWERGAELCPAKTWWSEKDFPFEAKRKKKPKQ